MLITQALPCSARRTRCGSTTIATCRICAWPAVLAAAAHQNGCAVRAAALLAGGPRSVLPTRDLLALQRRALWPNNSRRGVPPWEIDAGSVGRRLYAHSENLPPGADRRHTSRL